MGSANEINGRKRNKPCENCRAHRRKCTVSNGTNCDRCKRLFLPCLFKFSLKPKITKNTDNTESITASVTTRTETSIELTKPKKSSRRPISQLRKSRLSEKVRDLQQQIKAMEDQLQTLATYTRANKQTRRDFWSLVINRSIHGDLSLHTSVQNVSQLKVFLEETWSRFASPDVTRMILPTSYGKDQGSLTINYRLFGVEKVFFNLMRSIPTGSITSTSDIFATANLNSVAEIAAAAAAAAARPSYETCAISTNNIDDENPAFVFVKHNLINVFFGCDGYLSPSIVRTHFLDYLQSHPNSMLANAMVAYVACGLCRHVKLVNLPFTRQELGAACMTKARQQLEDALFDDDQGPTIEKMITLWLLANSFLMNLRNKEARTLTSMAWTMGIQLKDVYLPIVRQLDDPTRQTELDSVTAAKAETWRRLFYVLRYLELSMYMVYDGLGDFSSIVMHSKVGYPKILPEEQSNPMLSKAVEIFRYLITLSTLPSGCDVSTRQEIIGQRLMAAALDKVSCEDLEFIENRLLQFWRSLPREYVLGSSPIGLLDDIIVQHCNDPHVLYLNKMYYIYWFVLHSRFMVDPAEADMVNSSMGRMDSERALLIVSLACDSLTKITVALYTHMPCAVEIHWLAIVADMLQKLARCSQPEIKGRAERNLASTLSILNSCMQLIFIDNSEENKASCCGNSCTSGSDATEFSDSYSTHISQNGKRQRMTVERMTATRSESPETPPCATASTAAALSAAYFKELKRQIGSVLTFNNHVI